MLWCAGPVPTEGEGPEGKEGDDLTDKEAVEVRGRA